MLITIRACKIVSALLLVTNVNLYAQSLQMNTYCNPLNIDYTYMIYNANNDISYRSGAATHQGP